MVIKLKANPGDWQHLLLGKHPNGVEFPMRADYSVTLTKTLIQPVYLSFLINEKELNQIYKGCYYFSKL